jgi:hypothetical protein
MYIAEGLEVGRVKAMRRAGTNRPIGAAYNRSFGDWLNERPWARDIDKPTRNHLFWCADNRPEARMAKDEPIRVVRRAIVVEGLTAVFDEVANEQRRTRTRSPTPPCSA